MNYVITTLCPTAPWPYPRFMQPMPKKQRSGGATQPGPKPSVEPKVIAHMKEHRVSTATHMISAGVAGNASNVYRALRDLQDKGFIMEVANPNRWKHPRAKYYSLKDTS